MQSSKRVCRAPRRPRSHRLKTQRSNRDAASGFGIVLPTCQSRVHRTNPWRFVSETRKYRPFMPEQKTEIVLAGLRGDRSVRDVCREYEIAETLYYQWRARLLDGGKAALANPRTSIATTVPTPHRLRSDPEASSLTDWQTAAMPRAPSEPPSPRVLVLWDIDHTLIETRGVGRAIYQRAFRAAFDRELEQLPQVSGRTELDIMAETLRINGLEPTDSTIVQLARALVDGYGAAQEELATKGRALPGAHRTLALLAEDTRLHQSVLTGNLRDVARIKLEVFDLAQYLDLEAGAYGQDDHDRAKLVHRAQERAHVMKGQLFTNSRTILIGDTPKDIQAGKTAGVHVIGIASGKSSEDELREAGAERVLADLVQSEQLRDILTGLLP